MVSEEYKEEISHEGDQMPETIAESKEEQCREQLIQRKTNQSPDSTKQQIEQNKRQKSSQLNRKKKSQKKESQLRDDDVEPEPDLVPYADRDGVRIGVPCPLGQDIYTLFFISNVEHWYGVPIEHSQSEIDSMLSHVFALWMC